MPGVLRYAGVLCAVAIALALVGGPAATAAPVPDGPRLTVVVDNLADERWADILTMSPTGDERRRLIVNSGRERPSWSADGSLRIGRAGRVAGARLLLRRRGFFASPDWDLAGERISFMPVDEFSVRSAQYGNRLMAINPDGTSLTRVFGDPELIVYGATWQLGPGREAGRIEC